MINYINDSDTFMGVTSSFKDYDTFLTRINIVYKAYGFSDYADFWCQYNDDVPASLIMRVGADFVLYLSDCSDIIEISEFLKVLGYVSVLCDSRYKLDISNNSSRTGAIMCLKESDYKAECDVETVNDYKSVYNFFKGIGSGSIVLPDYGTFATDLHAKVRCNLAKISAVYDKQNIVSCCIALTDGIYSIISPVATKSDYRKRDFAKTLINSISDKNIYLYCVEDNLAIYKKMGFIKISEWKEYYR